LIFEFCKKFSRAYRPEKIISINEKIFLNLQHFYILSPVQQRPDHLQNERIKLCFFAHFTNHLVHISKISDSEEFAVWLPALIILTRSVFPFRFGSDNVLL
jgi:hypothetical protein